MKITGPDDRAATCRGRLFSGGELPSVRPSRRQYGAIASLSVTVKGNTTMTEKDLEQLRAKVKSEIQETKRSIMQLQELAQPVAPDDAIGRISRMDSIVNQGISEASLNQARIRLKKLEAVLVRMDRDEDFGTCSVCGDDIPMKRLMALPESHTCVNCAE